MSKKKDTLAKKVLPKELSFYAELPSGLLLTSDLVGISKVFLLIATVLMIISIVAIQFSQAGAFVLPLSLLNVNSFLHRR